MPWVRLLISWLFSWPLEWKLLDRRNANLKGVVGGAVAVLSRLNTVAIHGVAIYLIFAKGIPWAVTYWVVAWLVHLMGSGLANWLQGMLASAEATLEWGLDPAYGNMPTVIAVILDVTGIAIIAVNIGLIVFFVGR